MPRTTLDLDASVLAELRVRARRERKSLGRLASEILAPGLRTADNGSPESAGFEWVTAPMQARVDLEDDDALRAALAAGE